MSHIEPSGVLALQEALANAMVQDVPVLIHHIHSTSLHHTREALDMVDDARKQGLNVIAEAYPYDYGSSIIGADCLGKGFQQAKWLEEFVPDMKLRGRLKVGAVAEISIFDPKSVTDNALGGDQWRAGPELFGGIIREWGIVGGLLSNQWNIGGGDGGPGSNDQAFSTTCPC